MHHIFGQRAQESKDPFIRFQERNSSIFLLRVYNLHDLTLSWSGIDVQALWLHDGPGILTILIAQNLIVAGLHGVLEEVTLGSFLEK